MIPVIQEINFPSYATLHQATASFAEMGERSITTQVRIDGDVVPNFDGWELSFKGERFILNTKEPQAAKDNTTRNSLVDLTFVSWPINELKRYFFFEAASVSTGTAIADKYKAPVNLNVEDFAVLFNQVLNHYFGGKIVFSLYMSGQGQYSTDLALVEIDYTYIWDVLVKFFEVYGVRWRIEYNGTTDVYTIKAGWPDASIDDHDFEYGYKGGLLRFERQVQDVDIHNILLGRGGEKNLPYRYFKRVDPQNPDWAADPDAIPELANISFDRLRDINFRWYVRGWMQNPNRDTSWEDDGYVYPTYSIASSSPYYFAYEKGLTDERFNPVEYVRDLQSIEDYGEHWGALDDNDEVFPTIQGVSRSPLGRIDETVAVSEIITDDISAMAQNAAVEKSINRMSISLYGNTRTDFEILSEEFTIPEGSTGNIAYAPFGTDDLYPGLVRFDTDNSTLVAVSGETEYPISAIPAGTYRLKLNMVIARSGQATSATGTFGIENIVLTTSSQDADAWKPTFDIWVKNIWNTAPEQGESDVQYAERVWLPILGDRAGNEAKIVFSSGFMSVSEDYEFTIAAYPVRDTTKSINGVPSEWRITLRKSDAEFDATGLYIPNASTGGKPVAGDKFFFIGIDMPNMYVTLAEEDLNTNKSAQLDTEAAVSPTWIMNLDKVRVHTLEDDEYGQTLADRLAAGTKVWITDPRFTPGKRLQLYIQSITYTWNEPTDENPYIVPDIEVVLSDKVVATESIVQRIQSDVHSIKNQYARISDVEAVVRSVAEPIFLKKTGESDSSDSPTQFSSKVTSKGFRQGGIGGKGWGIYRDNTADFAEGEEGEGDTVIEVDRIVARKELNVYSLVVNQVEYRGGMEIISAAKIEVSKVIETATEYICYFDQRKNSVANSFVVGDFALGMIFNAANTAIQRYYKASVTATDIDCIHISKTQKVGSGVPEVGDTIIQYGHPTNSGRQYVIVRDVVGGGYERMISGLNSLNTDGEEYYFAGKQSSETGPRWFVGDSEAEYAEWKNGVLNIKGRFSVRKSDGTYVSMSQYIAENDTAYLRAATNQGTLIDGGLVLTSAIQLGQTENQNFKVYAGINGLMSESDIAAWYGGPMVDHENEPAEIDYAKSLFRFDGSGYLAGGNIHWDAAGYGGIPGVSWRNDGGVQSIVIDGDVKLASAGNDTVTSVLTAIREIQDWFEIVDGNIHVKNNRGFYSDSFISAGGLSDGGGASGITWAALAAATSEQINLSHLTGALGGYYTKAQVDALIGGISGFSYEIYPSLSSVTDPKSNVLYLIGPTGTGTDKYEEYVYSNNAWTKIGDTSIDLSGYVQDADLLPLAEAIAANDLRIRSFEDWLLNPSFDDLAVYSLSAQELNLGGYLFDGEGIDRAISLAGTAIQPADLKQLTFQSGAFSAVSYNPASPATVNIPSSIAHLTDANRVSTLEGRFDANGKLTFASLPALYLARTLVKSSAANDVLLGITAISNAASSGSSDKSRIEWDATNNAWHFIGNLYADGFVSAGGISHGSGAEGTTLSAVWASLTANSDEFAGRKIDLGHMPYTAGDGIQISNGVISATNAGTVTSVTLASGTNNGTLKLTVNGTATDNIAVKGLGAAAYKAVGSVASGDTGLVTGGSVYSAINDAISSAIKFQGITTTALTDGSTTNPITIDGQSYTAKKGDEVIFGGLEFLWTGSKWQQLGDEASWALKTTTISAGTGLTGGGSLASNRTISLSAASIASLALADSAYQKPATGIPHGDLAPLYIGTTRVQASSAEQALTGITTGAFSSYITAGSYVRSANYLFAGYGNAPSTSEAANIKERRRIYFGSTDYYIELDENGYLHANAGFYSDSFISAGGLSTGGGGEGVTLDAVWASLTTNADEYAGRKIDLNHLPYTAGAGISITNGIISATNAGTVTSIKLGTTSYGPVSGVVSLPAYPTTLPASDVYDWAKAATKPSYAFAEITGTLAVTQVPTIPISKTLGLEAALAAKMDLDSEIPLTEGIATNDRRIASLEEWLLSPALDALSVYSLDAAEISLAGDMLGDYLTGLSDSISAEAQARADADDTINGAITALGSRTTTLEGYFTGGSAKSAQTAARLSGNASYTAWGQTYWSNGVPGSISGNMTSVGSISMNGAISGATTISASGQASVGSLKLASGAPTLTWDSVNSAWHLSGNFYADGFISAGGVSSGGGASGIDLAAMWSSLTNATSDPYANYKIAAAHIPDMASTYGYATQTWVGQQGYLTSASLSGYATQTWVNSQGFVTSSGVTSVGLSAPTGFSVTGSPVTSSGTLALAFASGYSLPTTAKQTNWDTAYGWGNHASAGYLKTTTAASTYETIANANLSELSLAEGISSNEDRLTALEGWLASPALDELLVRSFGADEVETGRLLAESASISAISLAGADLATTLSGYALKTTNVTGTGYLTGGGDLSANRTIDIASTYKTYINNGNTAYGWGNHANAGYLLASTASNEYLSRYGGTMYGTPNVSWGYTINANTVYGLYFKSQNPSATPIIFTDEGKIRMESNSATFTMATPSDSNYNFQIENSYSFSSTVNMYGGYLQRNFLRVGASGGSGYGLLSLYPNDDGCVAIGATADLNYKLYVNGNLAATGAITAGSASDAHLKDDIRNLDTTFARSVIMASRPVAFVWDKKATELSGGDLKGQDYGLIAQEVEGLLPQAIGSIWGDYKRLDYTKYIAPLIAVEQDHEKRIAALERGNEELRKRLNMN